MNTLTPGGGLALLVGAIAFIPHVLARSVITAAAAGEAVQFATDALWQPAAAVGLTGSMLVLLGLPAMCASMQARCGVVGVIGSVLIALGG